MEKLDPLMFWIQGLLSGNRLRALRALPRKIAWVPLVLRVRWTLRVSACGQRVKVARMYPVGKKQTPRPQAQQVKAMRWDALIRCGDPTRHEGTKYGDGLTNRGWVSCPDNLCFDPQGRLWVCTDGMERSGETCDGIFLCPVEGDDRAVPRRFLRVPTGAECTGPSFTPDGRTLFVSIQHPGAHYEATLRDPRSTWPHGDKSRPPQPSVIAIRARDGGVVGGGA